ncbi:VOC family protein [Paraflavitalea pollutisoli]|uniref:VOC family protein n=1 Tax=Paraflavitalea pollutisoli TaxID=3034143 RepID=UPI0023EDAD86|nr:VOC family protein [Paraflavitalea sp. H1-2-19X]
MKPKMIWANFSVQDVARTNQFYTALGFTPNGANDYPQLASYKFGDNGFVIHFFEQGSQIDEYIETGARDSAEIIFTLSADTEEEVKEFAATVKAAGGTILREAGRDKAGYFVLVFADPDGHRFNVLLMDKM